MSEDAKGRALVLAAVKAASVVMREGFHAVVIVVDAGSQDTDLVEAIGVSTLPEEVAKWALKNQLETGVAELPLVRVGSVDEPEAV
jgi:hypothetical protein